MQAITLPACLALAREQLEAKVVVGRSLMLDEGYGLFAACDFRKGDLLFKAGGSSDMHWDCRRTQLCYVIMSYLISMIVSGGTWSMHSQPSALDFRYVIKETRLGGRINKSGTFM